MNEVMTNKPEWAGLGECVRDLTSIEITGGMLTKSYASRRIAELLQLQKELLLQRIEEDISDLEPHDAIAKHWLRKVLELLRKIA